MTISRRQFVWGAAWVGLAAGCGRLPGQAPARVYRVGVLTAGSGPGQGFDPLRDALRDIGYHQGQNLVLEHRYATESEGRFPELAEELVRLQMDVIVTGTTDITRATKAATAAIPIVMLINGDPVRSGLVASLARPGGNITGLTRDVATQLLGKRLALLHEAVPGIIHVALIVPAGSETAELNLAETQAAAAVLGVDLLALRVSGPEELAREVEAIPPGHAQALLMLPGSDLPVVGLAAHHGLPAMYPRREYVVGGGLMSYGPNSPALYRRTAEYVDRILKGTKPADLPVEQPREFDFVINLQTAQALGLTIPQHVLLQATEVIQ